MSAIGWMLAAGFAVVTTGFAPSALGQDNAQPAASQPAVEDEPLEVTADDELEALKAAAKGAKDEKVDKSRAELERQQELLKMARELGLSEEDLKKFQAEQAAEADKKPAMRTPTPPPSRPQPAKTPVAPPAPQPATQPITEAAATTQPATQPTAVAETPEAAPKKPPGPKTRMPEDPNAPLVVISPDQKKNFWEIPPEERLYSVNYTNAQIKGVLEDFARYADMPILNVDKATGGPITYQSKKDLTFDEYRALINQWLSSTPPGSILVYRDTYMDVFPLSEIVRLISRKHIYQSVEAFEQADVPDDIPVLVYYRPEKVSAAQLIEIYRQRVPDYCRIQQLADRDEIEIIAKSEDVREFIYWCREGERKIAGPAQPRRIKIIKVQKSDAEALADMVESFIGDGGPQLRVPTPRRTAPTTPGTGPDLSVEIIPDVANKILICQGVPERLALVESLVGQLDPLELGTGGEGDPVVIQLEHASANELATTLRSISVGMQTGTATRRPRPTKGKPPRLPTVPGRLTIAPETNTNSIILVGEPDQVEQMRSLIELFDVEGGQQTIERIALEHVSPPLVQQALTPLIARKPRTPTDSVPMISPDPSGTGIFVRADRKQFEEIQALVAQMDREDAASVQYRLFKLNHILPQAAVQVLNAWKAPVVKGGKPTQAKSATVAQAPEGVFVGATAKEMEEIEEILAGIDVAGETPEAARIPLENVPGATIAPVLTQMMSRPPRSPTDKPPVISADPSGQAVFVVALPEDIEKARGFVEQMDVADAGARELKTYPVENANVLELLKVVQTVLITPGKPQPGASMPVVSSAGSSLVVYAGPDDHKKVADVVKELDVDAGGSKEFVQRLEHASPIKLAQMIQQMMAQAGAQKGRPGALVRAYGDDASSILVVSAPESIYNQRIKPLIDEWDQPLSEDQIVEENFVLEHATPQEVFGVLNAMVQPRTKGALPTVKVAPTSTSVVVQAPPAEMQRVRKMIETLDSEQSVPTEIRTYLLKGVEVNRMAVNLTRLFTPKKSRKTDTVPVFIAEPMSATLLVSAPTAMFTRIEETLNELKESAGESPAMAVKHIPVENAAADALVPILQPLLAAKMQDIAAAEGGKPTAVQAGAFSVVPDTRTNRVVVAGPTPVIELAETLIAGLDEKLPDAERAIRIVQLKKTRASDVVQVLLRIMFGVVAPGGQQDTKEAPKRDAGQRVSVVASPNANSLVLRGLEKDLDEIEEWVLAIDESAEGIDGMVLKKYYVDWMDVDELADTIMALLDTGTPKPAKPAKPAKDEEGGEDEFADFYEEPVSTGPRVGKDIRITTDYYSSTMVVLTTREKHTQIEDLIEKLKEGTIPGAGDDWLLEKEKGTFLVMLKNADAEDVEEKLDEIIRFVPWKGPRPKVDSSWILNAIKVDGTQPQYELIKEWIETRLDKATAGRSRKTRVISTRRGLAAQAAMMIRANAPEVDIEIMQSGGRTEDLMEVLKKVIPEVKAFGPIPKRELEQTPAPNVTPTSQPAPMIGPMTLGHIAAELDALVWAQAKVETAPPAPTTQPKPEPKSEPKAPAPKPETKPEPKSESKPEPKPEPKPETKPVDASEPATQPAATQPVVASQPVPPRERFTPEEKAMIESVLEAIAGPPIEPPPADAPVDQKVQIVVDDETGKLIFLGPADVVQALEEASEDILDELESISDEEEIRVFHLTFVDVNFAAAVLERMFGAAASPQAMAQAQAQAQAKAAQAARQQQQMAARLKAMQAQGQAPPAEEAEEPQEEGEDEDRDRDRRGSRDEDEDKDSAEGERKKPSARKKEDRIRVVSDPRTKTIIIRARRADFPMIVELLAKIDKESPLPTSYRIFKLKNLNANDVEDIVKTLLGIDSGRRGRTATPQPAAAARAARGRTPQQIQQQLQQAVQLPDSGGGLVNPSELVTVTSDPTTNSLIVLAPEGAMRIVAELIEDLEEAEPEQIVIEMFELENADVTQVIEPLTQLFRGRRRAARGEEGVDPSGFDDISFSAEPRTNTLIVRAHNKDIEKIKPLLDKIDVAMPDEKAVDVYPVDAADVRTLATALQNVYGGPGRGGEEGAMGVSIIPDPGTGSILVRAPKAMRDQIRVTLEDIKSRAVLGLTPRKIQLNVGNAEQIAEKLNNAFGRAAGGRGRSSVRVTGDNFSRTLMVTASDDVFAEIQKFAEQLDQSTSSYDVRIYPMKNAKATEVLEKLNSMLSQLVGQLTRTGQQGDLDIFAATADPRTNTLVVMGGNQSFEFVDQVLMQLDIPPTDATNVIIKHFTLSKVKASEAASAINSLFAGRDLLGADPPRAEPNDSTNSVVVRGTLRQIEEIEKEIISKFEAFVSPAATLLVEERIPIEYANVEEIATTLSSYFEQKFATLARAGITNFKPVDTTLGFIPEPATRSLVVQATADNIEEVKRLLELYDTEEMGELTARKLKTFTVKYASPSYVVQAINENFATRGRVPEKDKVTATLEGGTQTIIVRASDGNMERIQKLIEELDVDRGQKREIIFHTLEKARPSDIVGVLQQAVSTKRRGRNEEIPVFQADDPNNNLIITATRAEYEELTELIAKLDVESVQETGRFLKIYRPEWIDPSGVMTAINQTIQSSGRGVRPEDQIQSTVEPTTQALLVTASAENHKKIEELLEKIDLQESQAKLIELIPLEHAMPSDVISVLNATLLSDSRRRPRGSIPLTVTADPTHNALVYSGTKQDFEAVTALVAKLDTEPEADAGRTIQVYPIKYTSPSYVQAAIQSLFKPSGKIKPEDTVSVTVDSSTYSLVVSANAANHQKVAELIEKMDLEGEGKITETVKLENATPSAVVSMLTQIYSTTRRRRASGEQPVNFIPDPTHNAIVLTGPKREIDSARKLIEQFDVAPDIGTDRTVEVYPIRYTSPSYVQSVIASTFNPSGGQRPPEDEVSVTVDNTNYTLIVTATPKNHEKVAEIIYKMDVETDTQRTTEVVPLEHAVPSDVIQILTSVYSTTRKRRITGEQPVNFIADEPQNAIVLTGSPREIHSARELIGRFDVPPKEGAGRTLKVYPVQYVNPQYVQQAISALTASVSGRRQKPEDVISVTVDYSNYTLIVSATQKRHQEVQEIISMMDIESARPKSLEIVELKHSAPSDVISMLSSIYSTTRKRKASGEQAVNFLADPARNAVILTGIEQDIQEARDLIAKFDVEPGAGTGRTIEVYPIEYANPSSVQQAIQSLTAPVSGRTRKTEDEIIITPDYSGYTLIISATAANHKKVREIIDKMDVETAKPKEMEVVKLQHSTPNDVIGMLSGIYTTTRKRKASGEQHVNFLPDPTRNSIVLTGTRKEIDEAKELITRFDTEPDEGTGRRVEIYPINYVNPNTVSSAIQGITAGVTGRSRKPEDQIVVTVDNSTYALIVSATPPNHEKVKELIDKMDIESAKPKEMEVVKLEHSTPDDVISMLSSIYSTTRKQKYSGERNVNFLPDPARNAIVLTGTQKEIDEAKALITKFDTEPDEGTGRRVEIYPINYVNPNTVSSAIQSITAGVTGRSRKPEDQIVVTVDNSTYALIVSATPPNHEKVKELIEKMDVESARTKITKFVRLENAAASDVLAMLNEVYATTRRRRYSGDQPVNFVADPAHNKIMVSGTPKEVEEAEELIKVFDETPDEATGRTVEVYQLKYTFASTVQAAIQNLTQTRSTRGTQRPEDVISVTVDSASNSLIVSATAENHEIVSELIFKMDTEAEDRVTEIIRLEKAVPGDVVPILQNVYQTSRRQRQSGQQDVSFIQDERSNSIIFTGRPGEMEKFRSLVKMLDVPGAATMGREIQVYRVTYTNPSTIAGIISSTMRESGRIAPEDRIDAAADVSTGSLIVYAKPENQAKVKALLQQVDTEDERAVVREVVELTNARATDVAAVLNQMLANTRTRDLRGQLPISVTADDNLNSLIITGSRSEFEELTPIIAKLDVQPSAESELTFKIYTLRYANASNLATAIQNAFPRRSSTNPRDQVSVTAETGTNTLIVRASGENHEKIEEIIEEMDVSGIGTMQTRVVEIENGDPQDIASTLTEIFVSSRRRRAGGASPITITPTPGTRKIVVTATEREFEEISTIIKELDVASTVGTDVEVVPIHNISVADAMGIVQEYLRKPGTNGRGAGLVGDVRVIPSRGTNALLFTGDLNRLEDVKALLSKIDVPKEEPPAAEARITKVIQMQYASPQAVANFISQTYRATGETPEVERVDSEYDPGTQSVIVTAKKGKLAAIEKMIGELDQLSISAGQMKRFPLEFADAEQLAQTLTELYASRGGRGRGSTEEPPTIGADVGTNSLLVNGSAGQLERIAALIEELDTQQDAVAPQIIKLEKATASEVLPVLTRIFTDAASGRSRRGRGTGLDQPILEALDASNSLIVRAKPSDLSLIRSMVQTLDSETAIGLTDLRVIPLEEGVDVEEMATTLERLINEGERNRAQVTPGVKPNLVSIGADRRTNSLLVAGAPSQFGTVERLAQTLEKMGPRGPKRIRIINLKNIPADEVKRVIEQLRYEQEGGSGSRRRGFRRRSSLDSNVCEAGTRAA